MNVYLVTDTTSKGEFVENKPLEKAPAEGHNAKKVSIANCRCTRC
jgi:hypothetical protein